MSATLPLTLLLAATLAQPAPRPEQSRQLRQAIAQSTAVPTLKPRRLLVFTLCKAYRHDVIPFAATALNQLGKQSNAYTTTISEDPESFHPQNLKSFDAVCFLNTTGNLFDNPDLRNSLLDFVRTGKGFVGIHAATDCFYDWPEYGNLIGAYFDGHPWHETVTIRVEDPLHPLTTAFTEPAFQIIDEIYQFKAPYSRDKLRVLLSLDPRGTDLTKKDIKRPDHDFAVSWIHRYGRGRVFYCSLGHRPDVFTQPQVLQHYLAGIQFALGDLPASTIPSNEWKTNNWKRIFNRRDLTGWQGWIADPHQRPALTNEQHAAARKAANKRMRKHWRVENGILIFDGQGRNLCTTKDYKHVEFTVDWRIEDKGDSGIYLRGCPQVQIWDYNQWPVGSGGLYNNQKHPSLPIVRADNPINTWNQFRIRMIDDRVSVWLNGEHIVRHVPLENYFDRSRPIPATGPIELQNHGNTLYFANIAAREIPEDEARAQAATTPPWQSLLKPDQKNPLAQWQFNENAWTLTENVLTRHGGGDIWSREPFDNFILDLEFRLTKDANSGIFFRTANPADPVHTGIEVQIYDTYGKSPIRKNHCGAIYDCVPPAKNTVRPPGQWNHLVLICNKNQIRVALNAEWIVDMNLDHWTQPGKNPDGSKNKFKTAYKNMPRNGFLGLQDHGSQVDFRNIYIKRLTNP